MQRPGAGWLVTAALNLAAGGFCGTIAGQRTAA